MTQIHRLFISLLWTTGFTGAILITLGTLSWFLLLLRMQILFDKELNPSRGGTLLRAARQIVASAQASGARGTRELSVSLAPLKEELFRYGRTVQMIGSFSTTHRFSRNYP